MLCLRSRQCMDVGKFEVSGGFLGRQIEKVELVFQVRAGNVIVCVEVVLFC